MKHILFLSVIFYCTAVFFALPVSARKAPKVDTKVAVQTVTKYSKHSKLFDIVRNGKPAELLTAIFLDADVNATDGKQTLLQYAQDLGRDDMVTILRRHGAEDSDAMPTQQEKTLVLPTTTATTNNARTQACDDKLQRAVIAGQAARAEALITSGTDINAQDSQGKTAAHHAAETGNLDAMTILIENHADINMKDNFGRTPYAAAKLAGQEDIIAHLTPLLDIAAIEAAELTEQQDRALALRAQNKTCTNRPL